jgi:prolipoprotein diacylglyceryltransferase
MQQVLFRIPILTSWSEDGIPIYGFGVMLFAAFLLCTWLGGRRGEQAGISRQVIQDLAIWVFVGGLIGARITYLLLDNNSPVHSVGDFFQQLPRIWDGGIILYGSVVGALLSYLLFWRLSLCELLPEKELPDWMNSLKQSVSYRFLIGWLIFWTASLFYRQPAKVSTLKLADVVAPSVALGVCLGRVGCFLNGCCYGTVVSADCRGACPVHFPLSAPARQSLVAHGAQTTAGFTLRTPEEIRLSRNSFRDEGKAVVAAVEPDSPAWRAGLRPDQALTEVDGHSLDPEFEIKKTGTEKLNAALSQVLSYDEVADILGWKWVVTYLKVAGEDELIPVPMAGRTGFTLKQNVPGRPIVESVEPGSGAETAGLQPGDVIEVIDGRTLDPDRKLIRSGPEKLSTYLNYSWPRGKNDLELKVEGQAEPFRFAPRTIGLHPTQVYETISMFLLVLLLLAFTPYKSRDGQVMGLLMVCYAVHRYLNELLRADDRPTGFESYGSLLLLAAGVALLVWLWRRPRQYEPQWTT